MSKWFKSDARYVRRTDQGAGPDEAWQEQTGFTVTPNSGSGTFTVSMRYKRIGSTVHVRIYITCTAVGTAGASIYIDVSPMPFDVNLTGGGSAACGINVNSGAAMSAIFVGANTLRILQYNAGAFLASGVGYSVSATYETSELP